MLSVTLLATVALIVTTSLMVVVGHRVKRGSVLASVVLLVATALASGEIAAAIWRLPTGYVLIGEAWLVVAGTPVVLGLRRWNPVGHLFMAAYVAASLSYLAFAGYITFAGGLGPVAITASILLWVLEFAAIAITGAFAFEACDVACRTAWSRRDRDHDPGHQPFVSIHVPAYNEPPGMLIATIRALEALDYPHYEIVVVDNNTDDPEVWQPVRDYCEDRPLVTFVHVNPWPGYKSGALNLVLDAHTDPRTEIVGIVDADYLVRPDWLQRTVGYFADPELAFVQSPQDYRDWQGDTYLTACYDAYRYFFSVSMPSRNERDAIIFGGTMGLIRREALVESGGWAEWCITEDAEVSLRLLRAGYSGHFVGESYGHGIMPLTFSALKRQRFRWAFGGIQILRKHWRSLLPWDRSPDNHLTFAQRMHYLSGGVAWFIDLIAFGFTAVLLTIAGLLVTTGSVPLRPLVGAVVLLPTVLISSGVLRGLWALRVTSDIGWRRAGLAFANWLSLSWTVALACAQGLFRSEGVFLRTPKWKGDRGLVQALRATRAESAAAVLLWGAGTAAAVAATGRAAWFLAGLFAWQGGVYASAPLMAWLNLESDLAPALELRRRYDELRQRVAIQAPALAGASFAVLGVGMLGILSLAGSQSTAGSQDVFDVPQAQDDGGPLFGLADRMIPDRNRGSAPIVGAPDPSDVLEEGGGEPSPAPRQSPRAVSTDPGTDQTAYPNRSATSPVEQTTGPTETATSPSDQATSPSDQATPPAGSTTSPSDQQTPPTEQSSPSEAASPPSAQRTEPSQQPTDQPSGQPSEAPGRP